MGSFPTRLKRKQVLLIILIIILLILLILGIILLTKPKSRSIKFISDLPLDTYQKAAVVSNVPECAQIGSDILEYKNGSAVDAAIAVLICEGATAPVSLGLGGGFLMTIYDARSGKVKFLNAKETAPGLATATMFLGNDRSSTSGGLAVATPGQLLGFWEAHQKYGRVAWRELFEPSIKLCAEGYVCNRFNANSLLEKEQDIRADPILSEFNVDPRTNKLYSAGDLIKRPKLAKTLRTLADAENPVDPFYRGEIAKQLADEIRQHGGIITPEDFASYKVKWTEPHRAVIDDMTIYTSPPPGSGIMLTFMLSVLNKGLVPAENDVILCQRFIETFKFAFAKRGEIADPDFIDMSEVIATLTSIEYINHVRSLIKDDKTFDPKYYGATSYAKADGGTGHVSVLAPDGSAVAVTSSINQYFGAKFASRSTSIVFNNHMNDFDSPGIVDREQAPPSPKNFIQPYKRPVSSMVPTIVQYFVQFDKNKRVKLIIGTTGGTSIPSSSAYIMALYFWNNYNLKEAVDAFRLYHQLYPTLVQAEPGFPNGILDDLEKIGHNYDTRQRGNAASVIATDNDGVIVANADRRRGGATAGF